MSIPNPFRIPCLYSLLSFLCISISGLSPLLAQEKKELDIVSERIVIHTDRQLYASGETIWFKVYAFEQGKDKLSAYSRVAYLTLSNPKGTAISRIKIELENGLGVGTIELPTGLSNGKYILQAYTKAMRNWGETAFGNCSLLILNPKQALVRASVDDAESYQAFEPTATPLSVSASPSLQIDINPSSISALQRSTVKLDLSAKTNEGQPVEAQFSVAITPVAPPSSRGRDKTELGNRSPITTVFLPETEGLGLSGKVLHEVTKVGQAGVTVFLAFPGKTALVYTALTDGDGKFSFILPKLYGLRQLVLQVHPQAEQPLTIELTEEFHEQRAATEEAFILPPQWEALAQRTLINAQVGQTYEAFQPTPQYSADSPFAETPFYGKAEAQYFLDDYTRFPIPEFLFEVVTEVLVRGKFGDERVEVPQDWTTAGNGQQPLLLVDGVPIFDRKPFLKINNKLIASIEVVAEPFWLNPTIFYGMIQLSSFDQKAYSFVLPTTALQLSYPTFLPKRSFLRPDYSSAATNRLPDFRNTLYWNPSVQTGTDGKVQIEFVTSDAIGDYEIVVKGVSKTGLVGSSKQLISVVKVVE